MIEKRPTLADIQAARRNSEQRARVEARAERVHYDAKKHLVVIALHGGATVTLPISAIHELNDADPRLLVSMRAGFGGESITIEELDIDVSIPGLLRELVGIASAAIVLGRKGGQVRSEAKSVAAKKNGATGGRPRRRPLSAAP